MINHLGACGDIPAMMALYSEIKRHRTIRMSEIVYGHLIRHLGSSGKVEQAEQVFAEMKRDPNVQANTQLYNVMIDVYAKTCLVEVSLSVLP